MRMLFTVVADTEAATRAIENGTAQQSIKEALERLKPEAAYFYLQNGKRTSLLVKRSIICETRVDGQSFRVSPHLHEDCRFSRFGNRRPPRIAVRAENQTTVLGENRSLGVPLKITVHARSQDGHFGTITF